MENELFLGREIMALSNLLRRAVPAAKTVAEAIPGLTAKQGHLLFFISRHPEGVAQRELEAAFNIRRSTASEICRAMEARGLLRREKSARDARQLHLTLTPLSKQACEGVYAKLQALEETLTKGLTAVEKNMLLLTLINMKKNLEQKQ